MSNQDYISHLSKKLGVNIDVYRCGHSDVLIEMTKGDTKIQNQVPYWVVDEQGMQKILESMVDYFKSEKYSKIYKEVLQNDS